jgi:hypothetical protein
MPGDDAAAVQALAQDDVVDQAEQTPGGSAPARRNVEVSHGRNDDVFGQRICIRIAQRALVGGADRRSQRRDDDGFRHERLHFNQM